MTEQEQRFKHYHDTSIKLLKDAKVILKMEEEYIINKGVNIQDIQDWHKMLCQYKNESK